MIQEPNIYISTRRSQNGYIKENKLSLWGTGIVKHWRSTHGWKYKYSPIQYEIYTGTQML